MTLREQKAEAVKRGVAFLDKKFPGWYRRVNLGETASGLPEFDVAYPCNCPLFFATGQMYFCALGTLEMSEFEAGSLGFTYTGSARPEFIILNELLAR